MIFFRKLICLSARFHFPLALLTVLVLGAKGVMAQPIVPANDGTGTIVSTDGNTLTIGGGSLSADQANLFHSFQQFGLNPDQIANFLSQPNVRNILGRVVGGDPSVIQGLIRVSGGNTNLYLINPSGIVFGPTARLDVPGNFSATTATSIQFDREFFNAIGTNNTSALSGDPSAYVFSSQTGDIINAGELTLEPGKVLTLIANTVTNTGELKSEGGQVILASMPEPGVIRLSQPGQVLSLEYEVGDSTDLPTDQPIAVAQLSELINQNQDYDLGFTLNPDGSVQLSVSSIKVAPNPGTTIASGTIDVSGATGGSVSVLGETVAVIGADMDASGSNGGGVVHVGGELQGQGTTPTAQRTVVDSTSVINVDATETGNGGEAIVWADGRTDFAGTITSRGGATGGDGGFVEVSGKDSLGFTGTVDTTAANGQTGTLLLDPTNITIVDGTSPQPDDSELSGDGVINVTDRSGEDLTLSEGQVESLLLSSNISLAATNNITIADLTDNTLGNVSSSIGNLTLTADADNSGAGSVSMNSGDSISIAGNITLSGASLNLPGGLNSTSGNIDLDATGLIRTGSVIASSGAVTVDSSGGAIDASIGSIQGIGVTLTASGNVTTNNVTSGQDLRISSSAGAIDTTAGSILTGDFGGVNDRTTNTGAIQITALGSVRTDLLSTYNAGSGNAGDVTVRGGSVSLVNSGFSIDAGSNDGNGGNVTLVGTSGVNIAGQIYTGSGSLAVPFLSPGTGNGGNVSIESEAGGITTASINSSSGPFGEFSSVGGSGGIVSLIADANILIGGDITVGGDVDGGSVTITSASGSVDTRAGSLSTFASSGATGNVTLQAAQDITVGTIDTQSQSGNGGNLQVTTTNGNIILTDEIATSSFAPSGQAGNITFSSGRTINANDEANATLSGDTEGLGESYTLEAYSPSGFGGNVSLTAVGDITLGLIDTDGFLGGGSITMNSTGGNINAIVSAIPVTVDSSSGTVDVGLLDSSSDQGNGGAVNLRAAGNVTVGSILSGSNTGSGGNVTLTSNTGSVTAISSGTLTSSSGVAESASAGGIITGSTETGQGGSISITAPGNIRTGWLITGSPGGNSTSSPSSPSVLQGGGNVSLTSSGGSIDTTVNVSNIDASLLVDLGLTSAQAALASQVGTELGLIITGSQDGNGGTVNLDAAGDIRTGSIISGSLNATGGDVTLASSGGTIDTSNDAWFSGLTREAWLEGASAAGLASIDTIDFATDLGFGTGTYTVGELATILDGFSFRPGILTSSDGGTGGNVTLTAAGNVTTSNILTTSLTGNSGSIAVTSTGGSIDGQEGVLLSGVNRDLLTSLGLGGDTSTVLSYLGRSDVAFGGYITLSLTGNAGAIALNAAGDIRTNYLATSSFSGQPGSITINSGGNVRIGRIISNLANGILPSEWNSLTDDRTDQLAQLLARGVLNSSGAASGGDITVQAETSITTGAINSSSTLGSGGDVLLDPSGDVEVYSINAQGGTQPIDSDLPGSGTATGGNVTIATQRNFRALGSFVDQNGITASISTAAPGVGGTISITHGGNGVIPFTIGVPLSSGIGNGTLGALTTGDYTIFPYTIDPATAATLANGNPFRIAPEEGYNFTESFGSIGVISVDPPTPPVDPPDNPPDSIDPPTTCEELGTCLTPPSSTTDDRVLSIDEARDILALVEQSSGIKPALIYISFESPDFELLTSDQQFTQDEARNSQAFEDHLNVPDRIQGPVLNLAPSSRDTLRLMVVTSSEDPFLVSVPNATRERVTFSGQQLYQAIFEQAPEDVYLRASQQLYGQLVDPIRATLEERSVENLVFIMDTSLRLLPLAALHDGQQYLIEDYSVGLMPSLSLTDTRFVDIKDVDLLAMGSDTFSDEAPLPAVPTELSIISDLWGSQEPLLNDRFTLDNLRSARNNQRYGILHLATHGDFNSGSIHESYIRFGDRRVTLDQLRSLRLYDPTVELMVLSACRTAVGNTEAELGFAGLAHQAGVKTTLGSLWYVGDQATLGLMTGFYDSLRTAPIKAEALRQAQLAMLRGQVTLENGTLNFLRDDTTRGQFPLRPETVEAIGSAPVNLQHPYAWSAFTMVGSPW